MKKIIICICVLLCLLLTGCTDLTKDPNSDSERMKFKENVTVNYGKKNVDTTQFVTGYDTFRISDTNRNIKEHLIEVDNYTIKCPKFNAFKMGEHKLVYKVNEYQYTLYITVKDKEKPTIICDKDIDYTVGDKIKKSNLFKVTDNLTKSKKIKKIYKGKIKNKAGNYKITCIAEDQAGNKNSASINIHVYDKPTLSIKNKTINLKVGQTAQIEASTTGKENHCSYTSSNGNIASVNELGLITAISSGQSTINVKANGLEEIVTVNVENIQQTSPSTSNNSNQRNNNTNNSNSNSSTNNQSHSTSKASNPSQYNKYFSGNSIDAYNSAYSYAESVMNSGKVNGYAVNPDGNGFNVTFN